MLLFLILPREAFANGSSAMLTGLILALIGPALTIVLTVFIAVVIKFGIFKYFFSRDTKITWTPFISVLKTELIIIVAFTFALIAFLIFVYRNIEFDMFVTNFLSYLSTYAGLLYFQKIFVEHTYFWLAMSKLLIIFFVLSLIMFIPNYKLLAKHIKNRHVDKKKWFLAYLLGTITPVIFCLILLFYAYLFHKPEVI
jgi:hypothetical protein